MVQNQMNPFQTPRHVAEITDRKQWYHALTWPYPTMLVASVLGLLPPFTFIGIPSGAIAVLLIIDVWQKKTQANDPKLAEQPPSRTRRPSALSLMLTIPFALVAGVAVFGGVFSCLWQLLNPMSFNFSESAIIAPFCVTGGVVCGSVASVFLLMEIYSLHQTQARSTVPPQAPQTEVDSER